MNNMIFFFLIVIIAYLLYCFIKSRGTKDETAQKKKEEKTLPRQKQEKVETDEYVPAVIAAAIAAVMGETSYIIKKVYPVPAVDEKNSSWRLSGRNESVMRRIFFKK